jgi:hypothetical protein
MKADGKIVNVDGAVKCDSLKAQSNGHVDDQLQKNFEELKLKYEKLKVVFPRRVSCYLCPYFAFDPSIFYALFLGRA